MTVVRILTDSTCDLPESYAARHGIRVVPCSVNIGTRSLRDIVDISREEFYRTLPDLAEQPHTSGPPIGDFAAAFAETGRDDATIVSLHPPPWISGIHHGAHMGAQAAGLPDARVFVVDSGQLSMGLGWQAVMAAEWAEQGLDAPEIVARLADLRPRIHVFAALDTLLYLRRSGRVNWAQAGLGALLQIKPILEVHDGQVRIVERVRTHARAFQNLVDSVHAVGRPERLAVMHTGAPEAAAALHAEIAGLAEMPDVPIVEATPAIGTHIGPGAVGFAIVRKRD